MNPKPPVESPHGKTPLNAAELKAAMWREAERQARIERENTLTKLVGIGVICASAAVFGYLELSRPAKPRTDETLIVATAVAPEPENSAIAKTPPTPATEPDAPEPSIPTEQPKIEPPAVANQAPAKTPAADPLANEPVLLLTGTDAGRDAATQRDKELLEKTVDHAAWDTYRSLLAASIQSATDGLNKSSGLNRFDETWSQPLLYRALLRWKTLGCFNSSDIAQLVPDRYSAQFLLWLLDKPEAMEELLLTIHQDDDSAALLKFLMDSWAYNEPLREKYYPLALACAVVFDEPVTIPHPVGDHEYGTAAVVKPMERYMWYVEKNEAGKLAAPVHHSSARDLVWVVCAPVSTSELDWAIGNLHMHRKRWGTTYGMIEYLMERAVEGEDPYDEYTFAEIKKHGGICGDQTYFCVNTARAQGIPAMGLSGETNSGAHAWAGLKIDDREWTTSTGRIGGVSKGQAHHPQTGGSITEQEILHWNDRAHQSPAMTLNVMRHLWLADFFGDVGEDDVQAETVRLANRLGSSFTETWQALYQVLARETEMTGEPAAPANLEEWKSFAADVRREFKDNPRMAGIAAKAETEYIFPYIEENDARRGLSRERRRIDRDANEQADLVAGSLKREADLIHKRGGPEALRDISRLYDRALRDFGGSVTGFKIMAQDYFGFMRDDPELARKAARDIELAFKRVIETGTKDWFRAQTESDIYRMICGYYRTAGDPRRAEMLEKRIDVLMRRAKRAAL